MKPNDKAIEAALLAAKTVLCNDEITIDSAIFAAVNAAYAAQFQSEEYAGLVKELRAECRDWLTADCVEKAADAIEALLADRDSLAALLAPVDDDILREIAARHFAGIDGHSDDWDRYVDEAKDYIDAISPHIEAAERERCAKVAEGSFLFDIETWLNSTKKEMTAHVAKAIAAAIRSGK